MAGEGTTEMMGVALAGGVLTDALRYLGVGGQLGVVALLIAVVMYSHKMLSVGSKIRNLVAYGMVFALLLAVLLAAGWGRLDTAQIMHDLGQALRLTGELPLDGILDRIRGVLP